MKNKKTIFKILKTGAFIVIVFLVCFLMLNIDKIRISKAAAIVSFQTGDWDDGATWVGGIAPGVGDDVTIAAGHTVTITDADSVDTAININSLTVSGILTHSDYTTTEADEFAINLDVVTTVTVNAGGEINVNEKGYLAGRTYPNTTTDASTYTSGASYGGYGGMSNYANRYVNEPYGSITNPIVPGAGGATAGGGASNGGGGVIIINANSVSVADGGYIKADGGLSSSWNGASAGGSVNITADTSITLSGASDVITANGGAAATGGSGGGGRIALSCTICPTIDSKVTAYGGSAGTYKGSAGTIYVRDTDSQTYGDLHIDNNSVAPYYHTSINSGSNTFDNMYVRDEGRLYIEDTVDSISTTLLQIDAKGYFYSNEDMTFTDISNTGLYLNSGTASAYFYGDLNLTSFDTSGGGIEGDLYISKSINVVNDNINIGQDLNVYMDNGPTRTVYQNVSIGDTSIWMYDTRGYPSSGTIYIDGDLISYTGKSLRYFTGIPVVDNEGAGEYKIDDSHTSSPLVSWSESAPEITVATLTVGGLLSHADYNSAVDYKPTVKYNNASGTINVLTTGSINVSEKGYVDDAARTNGNTTTGASTHTSGGSHGGSGGKSNYNGYVVNEIYDSLSEPIMPGADGGGDEALGGGGTVHITASSVSVADGGTIKSDGSSSGAGWYGGDSGGSIYIDATTITLSGSSNVITADGGTAVTGGAGGGGRVALHCTTCPTIDNKVTAYGGALGTNKGGSGTIYTQPSGQSLPDLYLDNNSTDGYYNTNIGNETLLDGAVLAGANTITVDSTSSFPSSNITIYIEDDEISCAGKDATNFTGCDDVDAHSDNEGVRGSELLAFNLIEVADSAEFEVGEAWENYVCANSQSGTIVDSVGDPLTLNSCTPSSPTTLYSHSTDALLGDSNPDDITSLSPVFSAVCNSTAGNCLTADIQVDNDADFSSTLWSDNIDIADIANSVRSENMTYAGTQLSYNTTYYWRIRFSNTLGAGDWSSSGTFYAPRTIELYDFDQGGAVGQGMQVPIQWGSSGGEVDETVNIHYSTDGFITSDEEITASVASTDAPTAIKSHTWTVPAISSSTVKLRICSNNDGGSTTCYTSEDNFTIQVDPGTVTTSRSFSNEGIYAIDSNILYSGNNAEYNNDGWPYRKMITFTSNNALLPATQTNFPALISLASDADLAADAQDDYDDIYFMDSVGTQLNHEVEYFNGDTGELVAWVNVPSLALNTEIYMYYGNALASAQEDVSGTWSEDGSFESVWHMDETSGDINDSANSDTATSTNVTQNADGPTWLGGADTFNGSNAYYTLNSGVNTDFTTESFSISAWVYPNDYDPDPPDAGIIYDNRYEINGTDTGWLFGLYDNGQLVFDINGDSDNATERSDSDVYIEDSWQMVTAVKDGGTVTYYVDGDTVGSDSVGASETVTYDGGTNYHLIGMVGGDYANHSYGIPNRYFNGSMDELRISSTNRDANWIKATYSNQSDPSTFFTLGSEEDVDITEQELTFQAPHPFLSVSDFNATSSGTGEVRYQVSDDDGSTWYYCVGDVLTVAIDDFTQANTGPQITNACLASLTSGGDFNVRSYLHADTGETATLEDMSFTLATSSNSINSAAEKTDGTGAVDISLELDDLNTSDSLSAKIEYKAGADCSSGTSDPTLNTAGGSFSADSGTPVINNSNDYQVASVDVVDVGTNTVDFDWLSATDVPNADGTYCVRATTHDGMTPSSSADATLTLDNVDPVASGDLTSSAITTDSITYTLGVAGSDTNMDEYSIYYKQGSSSVTTSDSLYANIASGAYTPGNTTQISSLSANTQYVSNIWTNDSYGHEESATELATFTAANTPGLSAVDNSTTTTLDVTLDVNSNPSNTEFAIQETGSNNYIQADGSLGASAIWQNNSTWSTVTTEGLNPNTSYTFQAKARNGDNVETSFGGSDNFYTLAEVPGQPTISNLTTNSFDITLGSDSNPAHTEYAIQVSDGSDFYYIQADNTLGASEVWQTKAVWDTTTVVGLEAGTSYAAHVKARNVDNIETAFDGTDSGTTDSEDDNTDTEDDEDDVDTSTDTTPPSITDLSPSNGATKISPNTTISFHITDSGSGVDVGTVRTTLIGSKSGKHENSEVTKAFSGSASDFEVTLIPKRDFEVNEQITLEVRVRDYADNHTILNDHIFLIRPAEEPSVEDIVEKRIEQGEDVEDIEIYRAQTSKTEQDINVEESQGIIDNGANIEIADLTYDGTKEIITVPRDGASYVRIYSKEGLMLIPQYLAYEESYTGGVNLAVGDLHGTGREQEVVTSPMNGPAHVRIFNKDGDPLNSFMAREDSFRGNSLVKIANLEGPDQDSGDLEIIILFSDGILKVFNKEGIEIMPHNQAFLPYLQDGDDILFDLDVVDIENNNGAKEIFVSDHNTVMIYGKDLDTQKLKQIIPDIIPFEAGSYDYNKGIVLAVEDLDGTQGEREITVGSKTGSSIVKIFNKNGKKIIPDFYAYDSKYEGGIDLEVSDLDGTGGEAEIITISQKHSAHVRIFNKDGRSLTSGFMAFPEYTNGTTKLQIANLHNDALQGGLSEEDIIITPIQGPTHNRFYSKDSVLLNSGFYIVGVGTKVEIEE